VYWAFGFPAAIFAVFGADFVFACGSIFIAKVSLPHEQSVSGAIFQTMTQVIRWPLWLETLAHFSTSTVGQLRWCYSVYSRLQSRSS
jgi:hypothetical protein